MPLIAQLGCSGRTDTTGEESSEHQGTSSDSNDELSKLGCSIPDEEDLRINDPQSAAEELFNEVLPSHLDRLYEAVGQFADGHQRVFAGSVDIIEHRSNIVGQDDLVMRSDDAVASLNPDRGEGVLTIFDPVSSQMMRIDQHGSGGSSVSVCTVGGFRGTWGLTATCSNCLVHLPTVSDSLQADLTARGRYGDSEGSEMRIDVKADLKAIPLDELSMSDVLTLNETASSPLLYQPDPTLQGEYYIFEVEGEARASDEVDEDGCWEEVEYQVEWFVHKDCLLDYGVRNLVRGEPHRACPTPAG